MLVYGLMVIKILVVMPINGMVIIVLSVGLPMYFLVTKAMVTKVIGMSQSKKKRNVSLKLEWDEYLDTSNQDEMAKYKNKLTHILCTGTSPSSKPMATLLMLWHLIGNSLR